MPIIVEFTFADGTKETQKLSAQIWRKNENKVTSVFLTNKKAVSIQLDPMRETADIDESNNKWPNVLKLIFYPQSARFPHPKRWAVKQLLTAKRNIVCTKSSCTCNISSYVTLTSGCHMAETRKRTR